MLLEQPSQYLAPLKGCADLVFFWLLLWQNPQLLFFAIHLTNVFNILFPCIQVFSQKKTSVTGKQLGLWLLTDLLFSLFGGSYVTPFRWVLLFQTNSAVIHKVAQCVIPKQIRYILIYFIHRIRTGPLTWLSYLVLGFVCLVNQTRSFRIYHSFLRAKSWLTVLHRTQSVANIPVKTVNN